MAEAKGTGIENEGRRLRRRGKPEEPETTAPTTDDRPEEPAREAESQPADEPKSIGFGLRVVLEVLFYLAGSVLLWMWLTGGGGQFGIRRKVNWDARRDEVRKAFVVSWDAYTKYAWGQDSFHPITKRGSQMSPNGLGWIIIDSLDTMMIMNLTTQLAAGRSWVARSLSFEQDQEVNTFETTIRILGGLLSAHYLSTTLPHAASPSDHVYLSKAVDLADRLLTAYESESGVPYASINLKRRKGIPSHGNEGASSTAETATLQLEMKYLAHLTGQDVYWRKVENVMRVLDENQVEDGLVPIFVHPATGKFACEEIRVGSRGDSYYEYLIKQYLQTGEEIYREMWEEALGGIQKHMVTTSKHAHLRFVGELAFGIGSRLTPKMDHLACFLPGSIALGATGGLPLAAAQQQQPGWTAHNESQLELARELTKTCLGMYEVMDSGLAPEIVWFEADEAALAPDHPTTTHLLPSSNDVAAWHDDFIVKVRDAHNLQRPEMLESLFLMYRVTGNEIYREWGWRIFESFRRHTLVEGGEGYVALTDVTKVPPGKMDSMEGFWLAETLKYLYLLFSPPDFLPLTQVVFSTEAHIFPRLEKPRFETGWARKPRKRGM